MDRGMPNSIQWLQESLGQIAIIHLPKPKADVEFVPCHDWFSHQLDPYLGRF